MGGGRRRAGGRPAIREWPEPERPRERLRALGPQALASRELLALLIGSGSEGRSALEVAGDLLREAGSVRRLAMAVPAELERVAGVGPAVSARVSAALELGRRMAAEGRGGRIRVLGPAEVYDRYAPDLRDRVQEEFHVLLLNTQHGVMRDVLVTRGTLDTSVVHPREVFRQAILESAASVILVHNHPSGDPTPSDEDRAVTGQLALAGELLGMPVLDHVVIGDGRYISFREAGLLARP